METTRPTTSPTPTTMGSCLLVLPSNANESGWTKEGQLPSGPRPPDLPTTACPSSWNLEDLGPADHGPLPTPDGGGRPGPPAGSRQTATTPTATSSASALVVTAAAASPMLTPGPQPLFAQGGSRSLDGKSGGASRGTCSAISPATRPAPDVGTQFAETPLDAAGDPRTPTIGGNGGVGATQPTLVLGPWGTADHAQEAKRRADSASLKREPHGSSPPPSKEAGSWRGGTSHEEEAGYPQSPV